MLNLLAGLLALVVETIALQGEWSPLAGGDGVLAWYLLLHLLASVLWALALLAVFLPVLTRPRRAMLSLVAGWCFCLATPGLPITLAGALFMRFYRRPVNKSEFESLELPEFDPHQRQAGSGFRQIGLKTFLGNSAVPVHSRLGAMVALQNVSPRLAAPLLRDVLMDPTDDLRLLAYGMLDSQEKRINHAINEELRLLAAPTMANGQAVTEQARQGAIRRLAELYWELVYQELAQGDLRDHALRSSLKYCWKLLELEPDNPTLHLRKGRLLHEMGQPGEAEVAYQTARRLGIPVTRILPYLAELAFEQKDFAQARQYMQELAGWRSQPRLRPVVDYWNP